MTTLPPELGFGLVVGRFTVARGDGPDAGSFPDGAGATGSITISSPDIIRGTDFAEPITVIPETLNLGLDADGYLLDLQGARGVWLPVGYYLVEYHLVERKIKSHYIEVLASHDAVTPADLTLAMGSGGPPLTRSEHAELSARIDALTERGLSADSAVQVAMSQQAGTVMRMAVAAGTVGVLVMGDSKTSGTGLTNYADRWQNKLLELLRDRFPISGGDTMRGLIPANMTDAYNGMSGRPTFSGTVFDVDSHGLGYNSKQLELGAVITFPSFTMPNGGSVDVGYHTHGTSNGDLEVLLDDVVVGTYSCAGVGEGEPKRASITIPASANVRTVTMRPKAATAPVRVMYAHPRTSSTGWLLYDAARAGAAAYHVTEGPPGGAWGPASFAASVAQLPTVRLAVIAYGANDMTERTPDQYASDLRGVVDMVRDGHPTAGIVVVLPAALTDLSAVVDDVHAYHTAARAALVDVPDLSILSEAQLIDTTGPNTSGWLGDTVHPNAFGHDVISRALAGSLIGLDGEAAAGGGSGAVSSVNGKTGAVVLNAADVSALPSTYVPPDQSWTQITGKPTTFTPATHTHTTADVTNFDMVTTPPADGHVLTYLAVSGKWEPRYPAAPSWDSITGKPATFAPSAHTHAAADVTSGVLAPARLGTGTASASTVLYGDGTWKDAPSGGSAHPQVSPPVSRIFFPPFTSTGTSTVNQNVYCTRLNLPFGSIVEIGVEVTTAQAGGTLRLGLYEPDAHGSLPSTLLVDAGTVDASTTGWKTVVLAAPIAWKGGPIYGAVYRPSTSAAPAVRSATGGSQPSPVFLAGGFSGNPSSANTSNGGFYMTGNHDAGLPATYTPANQQFQPMFFGVRLT